ncbi:MAG: hypothetical protein WC907_06210 [Acholeplasmataceae bacterium]
MSKLSRKILISVFTLVLTVAALVATTYAWFTLGDTVSVGQVEGSVVSGLGLEMRLVVTDPQNEGEYSFKGPWTSYITSDDINAYLTTINFNEFTAVTSSDGETFNKLQMSGGASPSLTTTAALPSDYIKLEFEFRTQGQGDIYLYDFEMSDNGIVTWTNDGVKFNDPFGVEVPADTGTVEEQITNSLRVSFFGKDSTLVVEKDAGDGNVRGKGNEDLEPSVELIDQGAHSFFVSRNEHLKSTYEGLLGTADLVETKDVTEVNDEGGTKVTEVDNTNTETVNTITYNIATLTVYIWVEGWDVNAYNPVFGQQVSVNLNFRLQQD